MLTNDQLIYDAEDFVVLCKPAGIGMHQQNDEAGICSLACKAFGFDKLLPVHRLDKGTSGLLLLAKSERAASELSQQFEQRQVQKYYLALSDKSPQKKQGSIVGDMYNARKGQWLLKKTRTNPAVSHFFSYGLGNGQRLFVVKPYTGKTHQIRVALKSVGSVITGDSRYGGSKADRMYLHAFYLSFSYQGKNVEFISSPKTGKWFRNDAFRDKLSTLGLPNKLNWPDSKLTSLAYKSCLS